VTYSLVECLGECWNRV